VRWLGINKDTWKRFSEKTGNYSWYYEVAELGYKYNMNDIMASIGIVQLKKLPGILAKKDALIARYNKAFAQAPWITTPGTEPKGKGGYWLYIIQVPERDAFMQYLEKKGITTGVHFMPMHLHPLYKKAKANTPAATKVWKHIVSLPLYPGMTRAEQDYVISAILSFNGTAT
jgi:perosamine synthetase